jgi:hypothetical protein
MSPFENFNKIFVRKQVNIVAHNLPKFRHLSSFFFINEKHRVFVPNEIH